jgi:ectoine hydroxylase-related dioxygenase (phytanoyl-CoA dioxygenase family)
MPARIVDETDPLDAPYVLGDAQIAAFKRDGFICLEAVLDRVLLHRHGVAITAATIALNTETRPIEARETYSKAFLQVMNLWRADAAARALVFSQRLARIAAELLGTDGVRLYHDQALYKEPGGGITPTHADQYYWPMASDRCVTAWIPLQAVSADMGPLAFYAGSHTEAFGRDLPISDDSERRIREQMQARGFPISEAPFALGDVSFHRGWTFHRAGPNVSQHPRSVMTVIYMDAAMRLAHPSNASQEHDRHQWCPGIEVGGVIASPINPVLWPRDARGGTPPATPHPS